MRRAMGAVALACVVRGGAAHAVEMVIGGGKDLDAAGGPLIVEFGVPIETRGALSTVLAWTQVVDAVAARVGVDRALLMAVIDVESGGNPFALSPKGAKGLMQLMPGTGREQGADDLFDPYQNVIAGAKLLDMLLATYGEVSLALAAYNAGEAAVRKYGGVVPPYAETQGYVRRVMERVRYYRP